MLANIDFTIRYQMNPPSLPEDLKWFLYINLVVSQEIADGFGITVAEIEDSIARLYLGSVCCYVYYYQRLRLIVELKLTLRISEISIIRSIHKN